jgi:hypothetical protein
VQREIVVGDVVFCKACVGQAYYQVEGVEISQAIPVLIS